MGGYPGPGRRGPQEVDRTYTMTSKMHHCSFCAYSTIVKSNLIRHARIHTGEKPFSCSHCSYQTTIKDNLKRHLLTHTGEKPFACPYCPYRAIQKVHLSSHMRSHYNSGNEVGSYSQWYFSVLYILQRNFLLIRISEISF